ncbi:MAG: OmpA family protein [Bacteriovoracaceae bacterium]|jgi:chemotaxis protein MotB|nr:OmpA family protein [Bacteriovoracaceae bacterium]
MAEENEVECPACPEPDPCPEGVPAWMATFADLVTLLLTFFVLLYAMSKTDESKFNSVAGSIRKAFAGNAMKIGETITLGNSPDDSLSTLESQEPVEPFPIDLLTTEGLLEEKEINRQSDEDLKMMKETLKENNLEDSVNIYEMNEGIKIRITDAIFFEKGTTVMANSDVVPVFKRIIKLMKENNWTLFVEGYSDLGERWSKDSSVGPMSLSAMRAGEVTKSLISRGVKPEKITTVVYGDSRSKRGRIFRRVEFILRKRDLRTEGKRVGSR